jgi:hypothetical protein
VNNIKNSLAWSSKGQTGRTCIEILERKIARKVVSMLNSIEKGFGYWTIGTIEAMDFRKQRERIFVKHTLELDVSLKLKNNFNKNKSIL